jgi:hypothetical protein
MLAEHLEVKDFALIAPNAIKRHMVSSTVFSTGNAE